MALDPVVLAWVALERISAPESHWRVPPPPVGLILGAKALHRRPSLDQRAIHGEMVAGQEPPDAGLRQDRRQEPGRDGAVEQQVAAPRKA